MVLSPHIIVGATLSSFLTFNPIVAFFVGFLSHFLLDAIPHYDYKLKSISASNNPLNREIDFRVFKKDLIKIFIDFAIGLIFIFFFMNSQNYPIFILGAFGGILPDALQILYMKLRIEPLISLQKFHVVVIHSNLFNERIFAGTLTQILVIFISYIFLHFAQ